MSSVKYGIFYKDGGAWIRSKELPLEYASDSEALARAIARSAQNSVDYQVVALPAKAGAPDRKGTPLATGCLDYFRNALEAVARHSKWGNDKHNPGEPLHWAVGKSHDHADCILRHLADRGTIDPETGRSHSIALAWRALALLEEELIAAGATPGRARK